MQVYLDIAIDGEKIGRIVCQLLEEKAPKTVKNFYGLCVGESVGQDNRCLSLRGNYFHRVIKNFMIQCGDIVHCSGEFSKTDDAGRGGCSIYATKEELEQSPDNGSDTSCWGNFPDENLGDFVEPFYLAMANTGTPNTNSSQFFITTYPSPHLNGKHSIFGKVVHGKSVVRTIERCKVDSDGFPESCIRIEDCGKWDESLGVPLYNGSNDLIGGDVFEEYPEDTQGIDSEDFNAAYDAANIIKESGTLLYKKKDFQNSYFKYIKSLRYVNEFIPDLDVDKDNSIKFTVLKRKLYLNLSLVLYNLKRYDDAISYATYLLDMGDVPHLDQAKAFYRRGNSYLMKNDLETARLNFQMCQEMNPSDTAIVQKIEYVDDMLERRKDKTRKSLGKFFSASS